MGNIPYVHKPYVQYRWIPLIGFIPSLVWHVRRLRYWLLAVRAAQKAHRIHQPPMRLRCIDSSAWVSIIVIPIERTVPVDQYWLSYSWQILSSSYTDPVSSRYVLSKRILTHTDINKGITKKACRTSFLAGRDYSTWAVSSCTNGTRLPTRTSGGARRSRSVVCENSGELFVNSVCKKKYISFQDEKHFCWVIAPHAAPSPWRRHCWYLSRRPSVYAGRGRPITRACFLAWVSSNCKQVDARLRTTACGRNR